VEGRETERGTERSERVGVAYSVGTKINISVHEGFDSKFELE
jgi:hypothetical protein